MHIAYLTPEYPHPKVKRNAGMGTSIFNLAKALVRKGVQVTVFVYGQEVELVEELEGVTVHLISQKKYTFLGWYRYRKFLQKFISRHIRETSIDVLEVPDWTGISALMKFTIPVVMRLHGSDAYFCHLENRPQKKKNRWFESNALAAADAVTAPSNFAWTKTSELFPQIATKKAQVIPCGIFIEDFKNDDPASYINGNLLYLGTLIRKKGALALPAIFNQVVAKYPKATLSIVGGDAADAFTGSTSTWKMMEQAFFEEARTKVTYFGKLPYHEVKNHLQQAHVCVFPTTAETFGMVTIEAMALEKAVVNSNYPWALDIAVDKENALLRDPKDPDAFATAILSLLNDDEKTTRMAENARAHVATHFDIEEIASQHLNFFQSLVK